MSDAGGTTHRQLIDLWLYYGDIYPYLDFEYCPSVNILSKRIWNLAIFVNFDRFCLAPFGKISNTMEIEDSAAKMWPFEVSPLKKNRGK